MSTGVTANDMVGKRTIEMEPLILRGLLLPKTERSTHSVVVVRKFLLCLGAEM